MNKVVWNERFNIGVEEVDRAHRKLFSIVRKLVDLTEDPKNTKWVCQETIKYFKNYTVNHFASEERYMQSVNYPGYPMHKRLHDNLREKTLPSLEREMVESDFSTESVQHFLGICIGWLTGHIMIEDRAITGQIAYKWVHDQAVDERTALQMGILNVMQELVGRRPEVVSEMYGGEDFGAAVFFRFAYDAPDRRLLVYLGYEERLVLRIIGGMLGRKLQRVDRTVIYAVRQLSQQLIDRIGKQTESLNLPSYQLVKIHTLSREMLLRDFEKAYPHFSQSFHINAGYFVFCVRPLEKQTSG